MQHFEETCFSSFRVHPKPNSDSQQEQDTLAMTKNKTIWAQQKTRIFH